MVFWWYFHSLLSAGIFSLTSWDGLQTLFDSLVPGTHSQLSWTEYHFSSQHYKILITNVSRYTSYEVEGLADLTRPDPDLEVMRRSTIVLAYLSLLASSRVHPYFSIPLSLNIWKSLFSSMYVTACISGHRIIFVWSWKKLICRVPLLRCKTMALLVLNQCLRNGSRVMSSPSLGVMLAPALRRCSFM